MLGAVSKVGVLGTVMTSVLNLGCCAPQVLGPLTAVLVVGGLLDRVPLVWQLPLFYGSLGVAFVGFAVGWRRHRRLAPALLFLPGAAGLLYAFHEALDVSLLKVFIWLGLGLLLVAAIWDAWLAFRTRGCWRALSPSEGSQ
jgi:hypothetical protein